MREGERREAIARVGGKRYYRGTAKVRQVVDGNKETWRRESVYIEIDR